MEKMKRSWYKTPSKIRRPLVLLLGGLFILAAGLTGWLPGPGGTPLFLIGIAILATEFPWAERLRDYVLDLLRAFFHYLRRHPVVGALFWAAVGAWIGFGAWYLFSRG